MNLEEYKAMPKRKPSKTDEMFNRAEALANTAKAIKGLKALDDDALERLYLEAKAERRARKLYDETPDNVKTFDENPRVTGMKEASLNPLGEGKKVVDYPHIEIGYKSAEQISAESEGELSLWDASRYAGWYCTEMGHNGYVVSSFTSIETQEKAEATAHEELSRDLPIIYV